MSNRIARFLMIAGLATMAAPTLAHADRDKDKGGIKIKVKGDIKIGVGKGDRDRNDRPRMAPPPPRVEKVAAKAGFSWVTGHYEWRGGQYEWIPGHWERERRGKRWRDARWEAQGDVWVHIPGDWINVEVVAFPNQAPPAPQAENPGNPRRGFVWVKGNWQ